MKHCCMLASLLCGMVEISNSEILNVSYTTAIILILVYVLCSSACLTSQLACLLCCSAAVKHCCKLASWL